MSPPDSELIRQTIFDLLGARRPESSICPSEVARALAPAPEWRSLMPAVVAEARRLARNGTIRITQGGVERAPDAELVGPIRLRLDPAKAG